MIVSYDGTAGFVGTSTSTDSNSTSCSAVYYYQQQQNSGVVQLTLLVVAVEAEWEADTNSGRGEMDRTLDTLAIKPNYEHDDLHQVGDTVHDDDDGDEHGYDKDDV